MNASRFAGIGVNTYYGMVQGEITAANMQLVKNAGIGVYTNSQSQALALSDTSMFAGWIHPDEPDNAQQTPTCSGDCPCTDPQVIINAYNSFKAADSVRPVAINVGRCLGNPSNPDRGSVCSTASRNPGDYPKYFSGANVISNDIYPVNNNGSVMTYIADAVDKMILYKSQAGAPAGTTPTYIMQGIETTQIQSTQGKPTPAQTKLETWLAIIHGATGIYYFVHIITPSFIEAGIFNDPAMVSQVTATNSRIQGLASVINSASVAGNSVASGSRIDFCVKNTGGHKYLFACNPLSTPTSATFTIPGLGAGTATVLDESRTVGFAANQLTDSFAAYDVHLYQLT